MNFIVTFSKYSQYRELQNPADFKKTYITATIYK